MRITLAAICLCLMVGGAWATSPVPQFATISPDATTFGYVSGQTVYWPITITNTSSDPNIYLIYSGYWYQNTYAGWFEPTALHPSVPHLLQGQSYSFDQFSLTLPRGLARGTYTWVLHTDCAICNAATGQQYWQGQWITPENNVVRYSTDVGVQTFKVVVPEPSSIAMLLCGIGGVGMMIRRRR